MARKVYTFEDRERQFAETAWVMLTTGSPGVEMLPGGYGSLKSCDVAAALRDLERPRFLLGMAGLAGDINVVHELAWHVEEHLWFRALREHWKWSRPDILERLATLGLFELLCANRCIVCHGSGWHVPDLDDRRKMARAHLSEHVQQQISLAIKIGDEARVVRRKIGRFERQIEADRKAGKDVPRSNRKLVADLYREAQLLERMGRSIGGARKCEECAGSGRLRLEDRHRAMLVGLSSEHWNRGWTSRYVRLKQDLGWWLDDCLQHVVRGLRVRAA